MAKESKRQKAVGPLSIPSPRTASLFPSEKFDALKFIPREKVPSNRRFNARGIREIPAVRQFRDLLDAVSKNNAINPYEIAGELDLSSPETKEIISTRRVFATSLRRVLRELLEEYKLTDKLMITSSDRGSRFFFVGK